MWGKRICVGKEVIRLHSGTVLERTEYEGNQTYWRLYKCSSEDRNRTQRELTDYCFPLIDGQPWTATRSPGETQCPGAEGVGLRVTPSRNWMNDEESFTACSYADLAQDSHLLRTRVFLDVAKAYHDGTVFDRHLSNEDCRNMLNLAYSDFMNDPKIFGAIKKILLECPQIKDAFTVASKQVAWRVESEMKKHGPLKWKVKLK